MYLFTQTIYLPHYFPVCLRRGCLFSLSLSLPVSPSLLLSFSHPRHPPPLSSLTDSLSQTHTHTHTQRTHTHTEAHAVPHWIRASDYSMPSEELLYLAFIRPQLQGKVAFCRGPDLSWNFTHPGFIIIRRCFLISIIFAAAVQGYISLAATQAI